MSETRAIEGRDVAALHFDESIRGLQLCEVSVVRLEDRVVVLSISPRLAQQCGFELVRVADQLLFSIGVLPNRSPDQLAASMGVESGNPISWSRDTLAGAASPSGELRCSDRESAHGPLSRALAQDEVSASPFRTAAPKPIENLATVSDPNYLRIDNGLAAGGLDRVGSEPQILGPELESPVPPSRVFGKLAKPGPQLAAAPVPLLVESTVSFDQPSLAMDDPMPGLAHEDEPMPGLAHGDEPMRGLAHEDEPTEGRLPVAITDDRPEGEFQSQALFPGGAPLLATPASDTLGQHRSGSAFVTTNGGSQADATINELPELPADAAVLQKFKALLAEEIRYGANTEAIHAATQLGVHVDGHAVSALSLPIDAGFAKPTSTVPEQTAHSGNGSVGQQPVTVDVSARYQDKGSSRTQVPQVALASNNAELTGLADHTSISLGDFQIDHGEIAVIYGTEASGKSLVAALLAGFQQCSSGTIERLDSPDEPHAQMLRQAASIGFCDSDPTFVPDLRVVENLEIPLLVLGDPPEQARSFVTSALEDFEIGHFADRLGNQLSRTQRVRLGVLRAMLSCPVVVLDDVTLGMARHHRSLVLSWLVKAAEAGVAVVLVTGDQEIAESEELANFSSNYTLANGVLIPH